MRGVSGTHIGAWPAGCVSANRLIKSLVCHSRTDRSADGKIGRQRLEALRRCRRWMGRGGSHCSQSWSVTLTVRTSFASKERKSFSFEYDQSGRAPSRLLEG